MYICVVVYMYVCIYAHENISCHSRLECVCSCAQLQDNLQDKLLENKVFSNVETLYADANAMKQTFEEARDLVGETREDAKALKREVVGGNDGQEEQEEKQEEEQEEEEGEEVPEDVDDFESELFGRKLTSLAEFMSADTDIVILSCVPLAIFRSRF